MIGKSIVIRSSNQKDVPFLRDLWKQCFQDSDDYLDLYFKKRYSPENVRILECEGEGIGMIHLLPCTAPNGQKALYWYAVGIHPNYQNQGYFRYFVTKLLQETQKSGFQNWCVPIPCLINAYQKYGFSNSIFCRDLDSNDLDAIPCQVTVRKISPDVFYKYQSKVACFSWEYEAVQYAFWENEFCNGKQYLITIENQTIPIFAIQKEDYFLIEGVGLDEAASKKCKNALLKELNTNRLIFRIPVKKGTDGSKIIALCDTQFVKNDSVEIFMTLS